MDSPAGEGPQTDRTMLRYCHRPVVPGTRCCFYDRGSLKIKGRGRVSARGGAGLPRLAASDAKRTWEASEERRLPREQTALGQEREEVRLQKKGGCPAPPSLPTLHTSFVLPKQENPQRSILDSKYSSVIYAVSSIDSRPSGMLKGGERLVKLCFGRCWATCGWSLLLKLTAPQSKDAIFIFSKVPIKAKMRPLVQLQGESWHLSSSFQSFK